MLLVAAQVLAARRNTFKGAVKLCFQPAEEFGAGRTPPLATENLLENTDGGTLSGRQPATFYVC